MLPGSPSPPAPDPKPRAYIFFDGQNLFHDCEREFGATEPDFCPFRLASLICDRNGWDLRHARFYTGIPSEAQNRTWAVFWANKGAAMKRLGVEFISRKLNYKDISIKLYDGVTIRFSNGAMDKCPDRLFFDNGDELPPGLVLEQTAFTEKGIDVRIAVDMIRYFTEGNYDVGVLFSRDKDLAEAAEEVKRLATATKKAVELASVFPSKDGSGSGVPGMKWIRLGMADFDTCRDPNTAKYFPKAK